MFLSALLFALGSSGTPDSHELSSYKIPSLFFEDEVEVRKPQWAGNVLIGFTDTSGNTDLTNVALDASLSKKVGGNRYSTTFYWSYTATDGEITERKAGLSGQYDHFVGKVFYYFLNIGAELDKEAQIDLRWRAGAGLGYDFVDSEKVTFTGEVGLNYIVTQFREFLNPTPPPIFLTPSDDNATALRVAYNYANQLSEDTKLTQNFEAYPSLSDFDDVFLRIDTRLTTNLTERMLGSLAYIFDWDNTPATGARRGDHRIVLSLGWGFGS